MAANPRNYTTIEEYFALSAEAEHKLEYIDGEIIAMSGASPEHNTINTNLTRLLGNHVVTRPCIVFSNDMRVRLHSRGYVYPDVVVVCGNPRYFVYERDSVEVLENPILIIEILSPSTERDDRGRKAMYYRRLPSLQEYILVSQHFPHIEQYIRQEDDTWILNEVDGLESSIYLPPLDCHLTVRDIYLKVQLAPPQDE